ncbi:MAG: polysaccharide biosynthesis C-terminal domain-containing protein, partial [Pseudomonadota bacterium]
PLMLGLSALSGPFVRFVFGEAWAPTAPVLAVLAPVGALQTVTSTRGSLFMAVGRADVMLKWSLFANSVAVMSFAIGLNWGVVGVATCYLIANIVMFYPAMWTLLHLVGHKASDFLMRLAPVAVASLIMMAVVIFARTQMEAQDWPDYWKILACAPLGAIVYAGLISLFDRRAMLELVNLGRGFLPTAR